MQGVYVKKPTLPKGVVKDMKKNKNLRLELSEVFWELERGTITDKNKNINEWIYGDNSLVEDLSGKIVDFSLAWITGEYYIDEGPLFYAKIKGWELVRLELYYWNYSISDTEVFPNTKDESDLYRTKNTLEGWRRYGINSTNADFEEAFE